MYYATLSSDKVVISHENSHQQVYKPCVHLIHLIWIPWTSLQTMRTFNSFNLMLLQSLSPPPKVTIAESQYFKESPLILPLSLMFLSCQPHHWLCDVLRNLEQWQSCHITWELTSGEEVTNSLTAQLESVSKCKSQMLSYVVFHRGGGFPCCLLHLR